MPEAAVTGTKRKKEITSQKMMKEMRQEILVPFTVHDSFSFIW